MNESRKQRLMREAVGPDYPSGYTAATLVRVALAIGVISLAALTTGELAPEAGAQVAHVEVIR